MIIHMELPYRTMADDEMRSLTVRFANWRADFPLGHWRAIELDRKYLELWVASVL